MSGSCRRRSVLLFLFLALLATLAAGCSGGDDAGTPGQPGATRAPKPGQPSPFAFNVSAAEVRSAAPQAPPFPEDLKAAVKTSLDTYLANGIVAPLRTGKPPGGLEGIFTGAAGARIAAGQPDRAALLEEGQPVSGKVTQDRADAKLTALVDSAGAPAVVTALVDFALTVKNDDTTLSVVRTGELVLVFDNNAWRIDAFDLRTARDTK